MHTVRELHHQLAEGVHKLEKQIYEGSKKKSPGFVGISAEMLKAGGENHSTMDMWTL